MDSPLGAAQLPISLLFKGPQVDEDLVLKGDNLWLLVLTGKSYSSVPVLVLQQERHLQNIKYR
jgi:hypothetical protein